MKNMRMISVFSLVVSWVLVGFCGSVFAAAMEGGPADLADGVVCGPEAWATVVIRTNGTDYTIAVRSKQIENCNVTKDAKLSSFNGCDEDTTDGVDCPTLEPQFINYVFGYQIFNIPLPIITKVKNFDSKPVPDTTDYMIISFDAQIKNYLPDPDAVCPE